MTSLMRQVDCELRRILGLSGLPVDFATPDQKWTGDVATPTVNAYLYDMRERQDLRQTGTISLYADPTNGLTPVPTTPPTPKIHEFSPMRYLGLSYLVTLWGPNTSGSQIELHEELVKVYSELLLSPPITLAEENDRQLSLLPYACSVVCLEVTPPSPDGRMLPELWQALNSPPKPAVHVTAEIPILSPMPAVLPNTVVTEVDARVEPQDLIALSERNGGTGGRQR
ncbi:Pvc16 family protein [Streptomyces sp. NPDC092307]|uniref:Pvc16 family protein n=1 Tax=Streptomyces sp. NPDC092307 TaxID=3366013 RepID=UPI0037F29359